MKTLDLSFVRDQFPAFGEESLEGTVFLENAGGSYMCRQVMERLEKFYRSCKIQPYYPNTVAMKAGSMMDEAYGALARWLNVGEDEIYFGPSTSQNSGVLAQAMSGWLQPGDEVIVTNQDHEANSGVWRRLARQGVVVKEWLVDPASGSLPLETLEELFTGKTRLLTFPHCSNILGEVNPVAEICSRARAHGVRTVVDGVSYAGHGLPDMKALGPDIYLFSLYKVYGPHQGVMVINPETAELLENQGHYFNSEVREKRLLPAGPDHAQIGSVKGVDIYFETLYQHHFDKGEQLSSQQKAEAIRGLLRQGEREPLETLLSYIVDHRKLRLLGPADPQRRCPTVAVQPKDATPWELARGLGEQGILCGAGHFYSHRLIGALDMNPDVGVLRFSLVHYTSVDDVKRLMAGLDRLL